MSRISVRAGAVAIAVVLLSAACAAPALAEGGSSDLDAGIDRLVALNPGVGRASIERDVKAIAKRKGTTADKVVAEAVSRADASIKAAHSGSFAKVAVTSSGGGGTVALGAATNTGDIFVSSANTLGVPHGHTGIYYTTKTIVEAPGPIAGQSRSAAAASTMVTPPAYKQSVKTTSSKRQSAATYAYGHYRGLPYNYTFYDNKHESETCVETTTTGCRKWSLIVNCSQLVWLAFKLSAAKLDVDGNGGDAVYPFEIRDSSLTTTYKTLS